MKKLIKNMCVIALLLHTIQTAYCSTSQTDTLTIGMKMPNVDMGTLEDGVPLGKFSQQAARLVILDFMNSSCSSCIAALPRLSKVAKRFGKDIQIYPVTYENRGRMAKMRELNDVIAATDLKFIVEDKNLKTLFPHQTVSHVVWILDGLVKGITHVEYLDEKMVNTMLKEGRLDVPQKNDFKTFDYSKSLKDMHYPLRSYAALTGYIPDADTKFGTDISSDSSIIREYMINVPIISAYMHAYGKITRLPYMKADRIIIESAHPEKYSYASDRDGYEEDWLLKNAISYEFEFTERNSKDKRMRNIIQDLDNRLHVKTSIEKRMIDCWVIIDGKGKSKNMHEVGQSKRDFVFMADLNMAYPVILDESTLNNKIPTRPHQSFDELRSLLRDAGYDLVKAKRATEVFVLVD
ncbi:thioredoxin family protein [Sphingobacterium thalpophilum]|uniref:Thioredoxin family protein n=1 Tax=Sphingobacterium thalpophilum TaxID=259 RepID=A0ACD5C530_9SPHI